MLSSNSRTKVKVNNSMQVDIPDIMWCLLEISGKWDHVIM